MQENSINSPLREARAAWRAWLRRGARSDLDVGITSSFTVDSMVPYLGTSLLSARWAPRIRVAPFNQIFQTLSAPSAAFGKAVPEILVVLPRLDELVAEQLARFGAGDASAWSQAESRMLQLAAAVAAARKTWPGTFIVGTLPPPTTPEFDLLHLDGLHAQFFERAATLWRDAMNKVEGVHLLDVCGLIQDFGIRRAFDPRMWYLYRQPFSEPFLFELGVFAARLVTATRRASAKCAVVDCDNTIWGGIVGEDGIDGIRIGDEFPGSAFRDFQRLLLQWRSQGVFLAVCSKNNPDDVMQVFRNHRAMLLREDDISAWAVNWRPKSEQLAEVAKQLNVGIDSLVFFDDSAYEIAEVLARHPGVQCVHVPHAPESIATVARRVFPFDKLDITQDDRLRVGRHAVEISRDKLRQSLPPEEFIRSLDVCVETVSAGPDNLARITQLINKTNQFRLTDIRVTQDQVEGMTRSGRHLVKASTVRDKFGEYGLTCVGILERRADEWHLAAFLLSCRVLGRGVETTFLTDLASEVVAHGGDRMTAEYCPTGRNSIAADFLKRHGFRQLASGEWWHSASELIAAQSASMAVRR